MATKRKTKRRNVSKRKTKRRNVSKRKTKQVMWSTREGKKVAIRDMTDLHLINATAMMLRNASNYRLALELLTDLDVDSSMSDKEYMAATHPQFVAMTRELELRGLRARMRRVESEVMPIE